MALIPIRTDEEFIKSLLTSDEIKSIQSQGLYIDSVYYTLWTKTRDGEMVLLGGGRKVDISLYPGLGEVLDTELPLLDNVKAGNPETPIQVINHLFARSVTPPLIVRHPHITISNAQVDKDEKTITFDVRFIDFRDIVSAEAFLTTTDELGNDILYTGDVIDKGEGNPSESLRTVTVTLAAFSDVRDRFFVRATDTYSGEYYSNLVELDISELPPLPGDINISSFEVDGGWLNTDLVLFNLDYTKPVVMFAHGSGGIVRLNAVGDITDDSAISQTFNFDYDGEGDLTLYMTATDLNGDPVESNRVKYTFPERGIRILTQAIDPVTNTYTATLEGDELIPDSMAFAGLTLENSITVAQQTRFDAVGKRLDVSIPLVPNHSPLVYAAFNLDIGEEIPLVLRASVANKDFTPSLPTITVGEFIPNIRSYEASVDFRLEGEPLRVTLEASETRDGIYQPIDAIYEDMRVASNTSIVFDLKLNTMNVTKWVRPVVHFHNRKVAGVPSIVNLDSHKAHFLDGNLYIDNDKLKGHIENDTFSVDETLINIYAAESRLTPDDEFTLIYTGQRADLESGIPATVLDGLTASVLIMRVDLINPESTYAMSRTRVYRDHDALPDPTVSLTELTIDPDTGVRTLKGTISGNTRPTLADIKLFDPDGTAVNSDNQRELVWDEDGFTCTFFFDHDSVPKHGRYDIEISGLTSIRPKSAWKAVWSDYYFSTAYLGKLSPKFDLRAGTVSFSADYAGIDFSVPMVLQVRDGSGNPSTLTQLTKSDKLKEIKWVNDESLTGELTYMLTCMDVKGRPLMSSYTGKAWLPETVDTLTSVVGVVDFRAWDHRFDFNLTGEDKDNVVHHQWVGVEDISETAFITDDVMNLLDKPYGDYSLQLRACLDNKNVHVLNYSYNYVDGWLNLTSVATNLDGDMLLIPSLNESHYVPGSFKVTEWRERNSDELYTIRHPDDYSADVGEPGIVIPLGESTELAGYSYLSVSYGGYRYYAKFERPLPIRSARIVNVLQSGRTLEVQWRLRRDIDLSALGLTDFKLQLVPQQGEVVEYDFDQVNVQSMNSFTVEVPEEVTGAIKLRLATSEMVNGQPLVLPASVYHHVLSDKAYVTVSDSDFHNSADLSIHLQAKDIVTSGPDSPRITVKSADVVSPTVLLDNAPLEFVNGNAGVVIRQVTNVHRSALVIVDYVTATGKRETYARRIASLMIKGAFRDFTFDRETNKSTVNVKGILDAYNRSDVYSLQRREDPLAPWLLNAFYPARDVSTDAAYGFELPFQRTEEGSYDTESLFSEYRLLTNDENGAIYSDAVAISTAPAIRINALEETPASEFDPNRWTLTVTYRDLDYNRPAVLKDSAGFTVDLTSELIRNTGFETNPQELTIIDKTFTLPLTVRMYDSAGNPLFATWPVDGTPVDIPTGMVVNEVKYVTDETSGELKLSITVSLLNAVADNFTLTLDGSSVPAESTSEVQPGVWTILATVSQPLNTSVDISNTDVLGTEQTYNYVITGDEVIEGDWGNISGIPLTNLALSQNKYGTYATFDVSLTLDESKAGTRPTIVVERDDEVEVSLNSFSQESTDTYALSLNVKSFDFTVLTLTVTSEDGLTTWRETYTRTGDEPIEGKPVGFPVESVVYIQDATKIQDSMSFTFTMANANLNETYLFVNGKQARSLTTTFRRLSDGRVRGKAVLPDDITAASIVTSVTLATSTSAESGYLTDVDPSTMRVIDKVGNVAGGRQLNLDSIAVLNSAFGSSQSGVLTFETPALTAEIDEATVRVSIDGSPMVTPEEVVESKYTTRGYEIYAAVNERYFEVVEFQATDLSGNEYYASYIREGDEAISGDILTGTLDNMAFSKSVMNGYQVVEARIPVNQLFKGWTEVYYNGDTQVEAGGLSYSSNDSDGYKTVTATINSLDELTSFKVFASTYEGEFTSLDYAFTGNETFTDLDSTISELTVEYVDYWGDIPGTGTWYIGISETDIDVGSAQFSINGGPFVPSSGNAEIYAGVMEVPYDSDWGVIENFVLRVTLSSGAISEVTYVMDGSELHNGNSPGGGPIDPPPIGNDIQMNSVGDYVVESMSPSPDGLVIPMQNGPNVENIQSLRLGMDAIPTPVGLGFTYRNPPDSIDLLELTIPVSELPPTQVSVFRVEIDTPTGTGVLIMSEDPLDMPVPYGYVMDYEYTDISGGLMVNRVKSDYYTGPVLEIEVAVPQGMVLRAETKQSQDWATNEQLEFQTGDGTVTLYHPLETHSMFLPVGVLLVIDGTEYEFTIKVEASGGGDGDGGGGGDLPIFQ